MRCSGFFWRFNQKFWREGLTLFAEVDILSILDISKTDISILDTNTFLEAPMIRATSVVSKVKGVELFVNLSLLATVFWMGTLVHQPEAAVAPAATAEVSELPEIVVHAHREAIVDLPEIVVHAYPKEEVADLPEVVVHARSR